MNLTNLNIIISKILYQTGMLEVIELSYSAALKNTPSLEVEITYNTISTLRQKLLNDSEICLDASPDIVKSYVISLQTTLVSVNNLLIRMTSGLTATDTNTIFMKELFSKIVSDLSILNTELNTISQTSSVSDNLDFSFSEIDQLLNRINSMCLGDTEKVERLIKYECKKSPQSSRKELIQSAITRWENDNR